MLDDLLCFLGIHRRACTQKFLPSIHAEIVTDFIMHTECMHCKKVRTHTHWVWNGKEMIDKI